VSILGQLKRNFQFMRFGLHDNVVTPVCRIAVCDKKPLVDLIIIIL